MHINKKFLDIIGLIAIKDALKYLLSKKRKSIESRGKCLCAPPGTQRSYRAVTKFDIGKKEE